MHILIAANIVIFGYFTPYAGEIIGYFILFMGEIIGYSSVVNKFV